MSSLTMTEPRKVGMSAAVLGETPSTGGAWLYRRQPVDWYRSGRVAPLGIGCGVHAEAGSERLILVNAAPPAFILTYRPRLTDLSGTPPQNSDPADHSREVRGAGNWAITWHPFAGLDLRSTEFQSPCRLAGLITRWLLTPTRAPIRTQASRVVQMLGTFSRKRSRCRT